MELVLFRGLNENTLDSTLNFVTDLEVTFLPCLEVGGKNVTNNLVDNVEKRSFLDITEGHTITEIVSFVL